MGGLAVNEEVSPMGVCAGTRARSVRISVAMVLTVALAWAVLGVTGAGIAQARSFSDVDSSVYHLQIQVLSQLGVINGFSDGTFRPDSPVTRQQFAKMVVLSMRMPVGERDICKFVDVPASGPDDLYPDNYVAAVAREGVTTGTRAAGKGLPALFSPGDSSSLAQVVTMVTRASGTPLSVAPDGYHSDWGDFDPAHGPTARTAQYNGLLRELPGVGGSHLASAGSGPSLRQGRPEVWHSCGCGLGADGSRDRLGPVRGRCAAGPEQHGRHRGNRRWRTGKRVRHR